MGDYVWDTKLENELEVSLAIKEGENSKMSIQL